MAKTKKEIQEQNSEEKQDGITAGLTDSELYPDGSPPAGMIDLELASATTLDPDASQTDENLGEAADGRHRIPRLRMMGMHPKMNRFSLVLNLVKVTLVPRLK